MRHESCTGLLRRGLLGHVRPRECNCSTDCGTPPSDEDNCTDGIDNDCDGATDCDDEACTNDPAWNNCTGSKGGIVTTVFVVLFCAAFFAAFFLVFFLVFLLAFFFRALFARREEEGLIRCDDPAPGLLLLAGLTIKFRGALPKRA